MKDHKKILHLFTAIVIVFSSCSESPNEKHKTSNGEDSLAIASKASRPEVSNPALGTWRVTKDTSHVIKLTEKEWIDVYNGGGNFSKSGCFLSEY